MADDDLDIEAMLEAPYVNGQTGSTAKSEESKSSRTESSTKKISRSHSRHRSHDRSESRRDSDRSCRDNRDDKRRDDRRRDDRDRRRDDDRRDKDRRRDDDRKRDRGRRSRSKSRDRKRNSRSRSRSREAPRRRRDRSRNRSMSPVVTKPDLLEMNPEERDARTVVCMQLASRIRSEDLEEFFSSVGKVAEVRLVTDRKRKSKGIAYIEFADIESVPLAIALTGQRLLGVPIIVQMSHAEKNRLAAMQAAAAAAAREAGQGNIPGVIPGAAKLYVGSLHYNITEDMLRAIFEPFGKLLDVSIVRDQKTGQSQGFAFLTFRNAEEASVALVQMNGFPLAGRPLKVGRSERSASFPDVSEVDKISVLMSASASSGSDPLAAATAAASIIGSLPQLQDPLIGMSLGMPMAPAAMNPVPGMGMDPTSVAGLGMAAGLGLAGASGLTADPTAALGLGSSATATAAAPPIATECLLISNLFEPNKEQPPGWDASLSEDIVRECGSHGAAVTHIAVDRSSTQGNVYIKCESVTAALAAVTALHGRCFDGRLVTAAYVPSQVYHSLFPGAAAQAPAAASTALASATGLTLI